MKYLLIFSIILILSCGESIDNKRITIDYYIKDKNIKFQSLDTSNHLNVAISAMTSPKETFVFYKQLLHYLEEKLNVKINLIQRKTYSEVNQLLINGELDFAFICSGAYVDLTSRVETEILVVPQFNGKCLYQAYIITNKDNSNINEFKDFKNKSFAFTDRMSNTGRLYALKKLSELKMNENEFFLKYIYTNAHDHSIQLVNKNLIDGATVDGLIYEYISKKDPEKIRNIKIIEKSEYFGIPPIVAKRDKLPKLLQLREVLLNMHKDIIGKEILKELNIDRFQIGYDSSYQSIREIKQRVMK